MSATLQEIVELLNALSRGLGGARGPHRLPGGAPGQPVTTVLVALEASPAVVREAQARGPTAPDPPSPDLSAPGRGPGGPARREVASRPDPGRHGLGFLPHQPGRGPRGLNDYLARALELTDLEVLAATSRDTWYKLTVFVPLAYEDRVREDLATAGLGVIGRYSHCTFAVPGPGRLPAPGGGPALQG